MKKRYLLTPGPTPLPPRVCLSLAQPIIHHRTPEFRKIFTEVNAGLQYLFKSKNDIFTFSASGTGAMEAAVVNLLSPGDKVIVVCAGKFGQRWLEICQDYNVQVLAVDVQWGQAVEPAEIKDLLAKDKTIKAVFATLCETSTGVVHDIEAIGQIVKDYDAVLVVDAISGLVAEDLQTDNWHLDCVVAGSQKGMMLPPGLSFCSLSPKAYKAMNKSKLPKHYFDFTKAKEALDKSNTAFTPAISLIVALQTAIDLIKEEGLENVIQRHRRLATATRAALTALGFKLFSSTFCNVVTSAYVAKDVDGDKLVKLMREEFGVSIANGQAQLKGKIIRLAHLGYMQAFDIITGVAALELALKRLGHQVEQGQGLRAAEQVLLNEK